jgi:hypothetical protein
VKDISGIRVIRMERKSFSRRGLLDLKRACPEEGRWMLNLTEKKMRRKTYNKQKARKK